MTVPVFGELSQLGVDTIAAVGHAFNFVDGGIGTDEDFIDCNGNRGTRSHDIALIRQGNRRIGGALVLEPTALELSLLLPWIMGAAVSGTTFALADTLPTRFVAEDKVVKVHNYTSCVVNRATFEGSEGGPLRLTLDVIGGDESIGNAGSFPSLTLDTTTSPFVFTDLNTGLSVNSATTNAKSFKLTIDNHVQARFYQSQTATALIPNDRTVSLSLDCSYGLASALYGLGAGGTAVTLTFTNAADVNLILTFSLVKVAFPRKPVQIRGKDEITLPLVGNALKSSGTLELVTTLASTP